MAKKKTLWKRFAELSWDDLNNWVGSKIVSQGRNYQQQGRIIDLAITDDGVLIAWVNGSERFATRVVMNSDGLPESLCSCHYELDCKHGVAVVLEYLKMLEHGKSIPRADEDDLRLAALEDNNWNNASDDSTAFLSEHIIKDVELFLKGKTSAKLKELIFELAQKYPEIAQDLSDRRQILSGDVKVLLSRIRKEIHEVGDRPGWQNHWQEEGYTPDYSNIRAKLEMLLSAGYFDEVLELGRELIEVGMHQIEQSHDDGETALEIESCFPIVVKAIEQSSLKTVDKLVWAVDAVLKDQFDVCEVFGEYLYRKHPKAAWNLLADRLLAKLNSMDFKNQIDNFIENFERDQISNWVIHALERANRKEEIIPLCEHEAKKTGSYNRLVKQLMAAGRHKEAEAWIAEGISVTNNILPGVAAGLKEKLLKIRTLEKNWPAVVTMLVDIFIQSPSCKTFSDCKDAAMKIEVWPRVSKCLIGYLECGRLPWLQEEWPLPVPHLEIPTNHGRRKFPMLDELIDIAIMEQDPDKVLHWYDQILKQQTPWCTVDEDAVAVTVEAHAPQRAVSIWQSKAEQLIDQLEPNAYQEAIKYLRKAGAVMKKEKKEEEWQRYLYGLRKRHFRKRRLLEIIDRLEGHPIVKKENHHRK